MKIFHVITTINRGGAENHLVELVRGQIAAGMDVSVAYLKGDGYWARSLTDAGAHVLAMGLKRYGELAPMFRVRASIRAHAPDIVHAHMPPAELYARLALLFYGAVAPALIITKHNDERFYAGPGQRQLGRWVARRASRLITISDAVNRYVVANLRLEPRKVTTVHYGIDPMPYEAVPKESVAQVRASWNIPASAWVIGTVARLVPQKALHVMLTGYAQYCQSATRPSRLVLVGRGPLDTELQALARKLGIAGQVVWAGFREDIPAVMRAFDCFALTSEYEGFGLVLLEAMAAGLPVVATAVSAIPEVVDDEKTGVLCASGDADAVAKAFARCEDAQVRADFGRCGLQRVTSQYTLSAMVAKTSSIYQEYL